VGYAAVFRETQMAQLAATIGFVQKLNYLNMAISFNFNREEESQTTGFWVDHIWCNLFSDTPNSSEVQVRRRILL
jgi:hypothetical protein